MEKKKVLRIALEAAKYIIGLILGALGASQM